MPDVMIPAQPGTSNLPVINPAQVSRLALLLSGNKAAMADAGVSAPVDQGTNPATVAMPTSPLAYKAPATAAPQPAASSVMPSMPTAAPAMDAQPGAPPPAPALSPISYRPLPTAPVAPTTDLDARQKLADAVAKDSQRTDPNDPNAKPKWYDRLFGGMATFGAAMQHNPNAVGIGQDIVGRRYQQAENAREGRLDADKSALGQFDQNTSQADKDYQRQRDVFADQLKGAEEERRQKSETSLSSERAAKASKYENAVDPNSLRQGEDGKWYGRTYGDPEKEIETSGPKGFKGDVTGQRTKDADKMGLKGAERTQYIANGKIDTRQDRAPSDLEMWTQAFVRDNNRQPTAEEIANRKVTQKATPAATNALLDKATKEKEQKWKEETDAHTRAVNAMSDPKSKAYIADPTARSAAELEAKQKHVQSLQEIQNDWEGTLERAGVPVDHYDASTERKMSEAGGKRPAAAPAQTAPVNEERVPVISPDGKTRGSVPKSQLSIALGKGYKQVKP